MEALGTAMSVAQNLYAALQSAKLKDFFSVFGYESKIQDLQRTVSTIKAVFEDAERKQSLSAVEHRLIEDLKDAIYEADDFLDEFVSLAEQKQLLTAHGSFSEKIRNFLTHTNPFLVANKMSKGVNKIRERLDAIVDNKRFDVVHHPERFAHDPEPLRKRMLESCSYVNESDIIGRGEDLKKIIGMLLHSNDQQELSSLTIFGIGGLGKTALAQLVYNDPAVINAFQSRMWTCVSDQDQKQLDVKEVLRKTLASASGSKPDEDCTLDKLQCHLRQQLDGKRYLLVLDDVWTEERNQWCKLEHYFIGGQRGSWIVVTTRSERTATIIGGQKYNLQGLSKEDSWRLFERAAFGSDESYPLDDNLVDKFKREIVDECAQVPLAIKVIGSLLYCQDKSKWLSIMKIGSTNIMKSNSDIMSILKLSYSHLGSPLKSCFNYCAMFPKDFVMPKDMLIDLWMAQGYVVPTYDGQCVEEAGEEYFSILLKRCFFQDIQKNTSGEIVACKMHDLIHDLAQSVSGKEIYASSIDNENINEKVRHYAFSIPIKEHMKHSLYRSHVRSCIRLGRTTYIDSVGEEYVFLKALISRCRDLRALNFFNANMKSLPASISTLLHLRHLDLSYNTEMEVLPKSISKLYNLQTLKLDYCETLKELPEDLSKMVKLRVLSISYCTKLKYMPRGMDKLTCLYSLSDFIVGSKKRFVSWKPLFDGLEDQKAPSNIKGSLCVSIKGPQKVDDIGKRSILRNTEYLDEIFINFKDKEFEGRNDEEVSIGLMEDLHPHPNLKKLVMSDYEGTIMACWASFLPNLVELKLFYCVHLKEYMRGGRVGVGDASISSSMGNNEHQLQSLSCLPQLKSLRIYNCPELTWIPLCPKVEILDLMIFNKNMIFGDVSHASTLTTCHKFKKLRIDNMSWLNSQPMKAFQCLELLEINFVKEMEKLGEIREVFSSCTSSLRCLIIFECPKLGRVVSGALENLRTLEELEFANCINLKLLEEEREGDDVGIKPLLPSLRTLKLKCLPQLENLPSWMQFLPALQTLKIDNCKSLKAMPSWMSKLTSLKYLLVEFCSKSLERRCRKDPQGEDWPFIHHIPTIHFYRSDNAEETMFRALRVFSWWRPGQT